MSSASSSDMTLPSSNEKLRIDKALTAEPKNCKDLRLMGFFDSGVSDSGGGGANRLRVPYQPLSVLMKYLSRRNVCPAMSDSCCVLDSRDSSE